MERKEHLEMEQVPLKSDTDKPATEDVKYTTETVEHGPDGQTTNVKTVTTKRYFFWTKKPTKGEKGGTDGADVVLSEGETKAKVAPAESKTGSLKRFWEKRPRAANGPGGETDGGHCPMTVGINMLDRDEKNIGETVKLSYEDIWGEPDSVRSVDCVWRTNYRIFTAVRCFTYKLLSLIVMLPMAIIWALLFAILAVLNIWCCVPFGRALTIPFTWIAKAWNHIVRGVFDPFFRSCGLCLGSVNIRRYGINNDATDIV